MQSNEAKIGKAMADHHQDDIQESLDAFMEDYPKRYSTISNSELRSLLTAAFICGVSAQVNNPVEEEQLQAALSNQ